MGLLISSALIILGGFFQLYVIIISGQAFPLDLFPGYTESSSFQDGIVSPYTPSMYEFMLGLGGIGISAVIYIFAITCPINHMVSMFHTCSKLRPLRFGKECSMKGN